VYWNLIKNITSITLILLCFYLSELNVISGALSEFSYHYYANILWVILLWIQALSLALQYRYTIEGWVCSLSLLYISLYSFGEFLHNEVAVLFFLSSCVIAFRSSYKTGTGILLVSLPFLFLCEGYAMFELTFCLLLNIIIQQERCRNIRSVIRWS